MAKKLSRGKMKVVIYGPASALLPSIERIAKKRGVTTRILGGGPGGSCGSRAAKEPD